MKLIGVPLTQCEGTLPKGHRCWRRRAQGALLQGESLLQVDLAVFTRGGHQKTILLHVEFAHLRNHFNGGCLHVRTSKELRIGIGHPGVSRDVADYVLKKPSAADATLIEEAMYTALNELPAVVDGKSRL